MLDRASILAAKDIITETFPIPQWGGDVTIRMLTGEQREELESRIQTFKSGAKKSVRALAAVYSLVGEDGAPLFTQSDVAELAAKSGVALDTIFDHVLKLNAMTKAEAGELEKN